MQSYKSERQRQLDNVQKELLTNYYLQKYNSIMSGISKQPESIQKVEVLPKPKQSESKSQRMNFKNMILMKKNQNHHTVNRVPKISNQQSHLIKPNNDSIVHKYSSREQQQNQKTMRKLEESIINELYRPSPSKLQQGSYKKIQIGSSLSKKDGSTNKKPDFEHVHQENIEITYEEEHQINSFNEDDELFPDQKETISKVKQAIKIQFDRRKDNSLSPQKNSRKNSEVKSSKISVQIKIQSPKKLQKAATPNKYGNMKSSKQRSKYSKNESSNRSSSYDGSRQHIEQGNKNQVSSFSSQKNHQVYFSNDAVQPFTITSKQHERQYDEIKQQQQIEFVPPTSNYYMSNNNNLVQQSFKYQEEVRENRDPGSQKAHSIASSRKSSKDKKMVRNDSKKSIRSRRKSQFKDSSKMEMSFVSKMSMLSSNQGHLIKQKIEKQLYDNELGPYQSALYHIVELMEKYPKSGPIYAVGQKALDDRRIFEQRRLQQESQLSQLKRNTQKLKRKSQIKTNDKQDHQITSNQLQILRLIRKLSTTL